MMLVVVLYMLFALTFTLAKTSLYYVKPIFFIGIRMTISGLALLAYFFFSHTKKIRFSRHDIMLFMNIIFFHIYGSYIFEFWALQHIVSSKACFFYNLSPFFSALFSYLWLSERLSRNQIMGLIVGFVGFLPMIVTGQTEEAAGALGFLSLPEVVMFLAVLCSVYGWIVMKQLISNDRYSPIMVNGIGMFFGGIAAFFTSLVIEKNDFFGAGKIAIEKDSFFISMQSYLLDLFSAQSVDLLMFSIYAGLLMIIANIICYNLYGFLLRNYSATLLSFSGFMTPFFATIFGWFFLGEPLAPSFFLSFAAVSIGLYLFYREELQRA